MIRPRSSLIHRPPQFQFTSIPLALQPTLNETRMQASWSENCRSDNESVVTYDSAVTAVSNCYLPPMDLNMQQRRSRRRQLIVEPLAKPVQADSLANEKAAAVSSVPVDYFEMFPMPNHRVGETALRRLQAPSSLTTKLRDVGDVDVTREGDALEAAWDDESCIDGSSPRMVANDRFADQPQPSAMADGMPERFEVDALRRQVEQLQMALQLQGKQLARAESQQTHAQRRPRTAGSMQLSQQATYPVQWMPAPPTGALPPPPPPPPQRSPTRPVHAAHHGAAPPTAMYNATPATGIAAPILLPRSHCPSVPSAAASSQHMQQQSYFDARRPTTASTVYHPFADRPEVETPHSLSPSTSTSQTLIDVDRLDHLNRKVAELEMLIGAINVQRPPPPPLSKTISPSPIPINLPPLTSTESRDSTSFHYNPTLPPPTLSSGSSVRSSNASAHESRGSKLAAVLRLKKPNSMSNDSCLEIPQTTESRVSWSRKRTEKVAKPTAKVRQGPGRGRIMIREAAA